MLLSERVEALTGPNREIDALIADTVGFGREQQGAFGYLSAFTESLDAAVTLVGKHGFWRVGHDGEGQDPSAFKAQVGVEREGECWHTFATAISDTAAIALTAAALRSRGL